MMTELDPPGDVVPPVLTVDRLSTAFPGPSGPIQVVRDFDASLRPGEVLGLVGESGSGKTIAALSIMRLLRQSWGATVSGKVNLAGRDLLSRTDEEMQQIRGGEIAYVFQDPMSALNPSLTIGAQIGEAIRKHTPMSRRASRALVVDLLGRVGIPHPEARLRDYPHQFSGGMRQRVMIAMAISCGPKAIIADEPTTGLDVTVQAQILELFRSIVEDLGTSILLITHDLGVVASLADVVTVMYAGSVVEQGSVYQVLESPRHPYTEALMRAVPSMERTGQSLVTIEGSPPDPSTVSTGCPFVERCELAITVCHEESPQLTVRLEDGSARRVACYMR